MRRLLLRCDATRTTGAGHGVRCLALAEEARSRGWDVTWSGAIDGVPWLAGRVAALGVEVVAGAADGATLAALVTSTSADAVVVDHYGLPADVREAIGGRAAVISIEDGMFGRRPADVVVDTNLDASQRPDDGSPLVLAGPRYALLRAVVRAARSQRPTPPRTGNLALVLVVMGGTDARGVTTAAIAAATRSGADEVLVVTHDADLDKRAAGVRLLAPDPDLPLAMAEATVVISAAGVSTLELCCIGVTGALVWVADNQRAGYEFLVTAGAAWGLGPADRLHDDPEGAAGELCGLLTDAPLRARLEQRAQALVDGLGAQRVLDVIEQVTAGTAPRTSEGGHG